MQFTGCLSCDLLLEGVEGEEGKGEVESGISTMSQGHT